MIPPICLLFPNEENPCNRCWYYDPENKQVSRFKRSLENPGCSIGYKKPKDYKEIKSNES